MLGIGAIIGYLTSKETKKYDIMEVLKNGTIWGVILGAVAVFGYYLGMSTYINKVLPQSWLSGTGLSIIFFGPFIYGIVETLFGSFAYPIYKWMKTIRI